MGSVGKKGQGAGNTEKWKWSEVERGCWETAGGKGESMR